MKTKRSIKDQKGATLVEFAIVLPLLALLVGGMIEFGLLLFNQQVIVNASREGARASIVVEPNMMSDGIIKTIVKTYCDGHLITFQGSSVVNSNDIYICDADVTPPCTLDRNSSSFQDNIAVTVSFDYYYLLPALLNYGTPKTLTAKTAMKLEQPSPTP